MLRHAGGVSGFILQARVLTEALPFTSGCVHPHCRSARLLMGNPAERTGHLSSCLPALTWPRWTTGLDNRGGRGGGGEADKEYTAGAMKSDTDRVDRVRELKYTHQMPVIDAKIGEDQADAM